MSSTSSKALFTVAGLLNSAPTACSFLFRPRFAKQEDDLARFDGRQLNGDLQRGAGIESGAIASAKFRAAQSRRTSSVPLRPMNSLRSQVALEIFSLVATKATRSANSLLKGFRAKIVPGCCVDFGDDVRRGSSAQHAEHQFVIKRDR